MRRYLDSSALVKLIQREPESEALRQFLQHNRADDLVTSALARVEVVRAVSAGGVGAVVQARRLLNRVGQLTITRELLDSAATLAPTVRLRSLDAIHLASAQLIGTELKSVVTYDGRMADAASSIGLAVEQPE